LLLPCVKDEIANSLSGVYETVKNRVSLINDELDSDLKDIEVSEFSISLPAPQKIADLIQNIQFRVMDEIESELDTKGMGVQALAVMAVPALASKILSKSQTKRHMAYRGTESFLHPSLMSTQMKIINKPSKRSTVIYATHNWSFVPENEKNILGINKVGRETRLQEFGLIDEAREILHGTLGVQISHSR
jgi:hypothetical protein